MTRIYKPDPRRNTYKKYTAEAINEALADHQQEMYFRWILKKSGNSYCSALSKGKKNTVWKVKDQLVLNQEIEK